MSTSNFTSQCELNNFTLIDSSAVTLEPTSREQPRRNVEVHCTKFCYHKFDKRLLLKLIYLLFKIVLFAGSIIIFGRITLIFLTNSEPEIYMSFTNDDYLSAAFVVCTSRLFKINGITNCTL